MCDVLKSGGPLINHQPVEDRWILCDPILHLCVPFTGTHHFTNWTKLYGYCLTRYHIVCLIHRDPSFYKTERSPLRTRSPPQEPTCTKFNTTGKQCMQESSGLPRRSPPSPGRSLPLSRRGRINFQDGLGLTQANLPSPR